MHKAGLKKTWEKIWDIREQDTCSPASGEPLWRGEADRPSSSGLCTHLSLSTPCPVPELGVCSCDRFLISARTRTLAQDHHRKCTEHSRDDLHCTNCDPKLIGWVQAPAGPCWAALEMDSLRQSNHLGKGLWPLAHLLDTTLKEDMESPPLRFPLHLLGPT